MFNFLKEKLKSWAKKIEGETEEVIDISAKTSTKEKKPKKEKQTKEKKVKTKKSKEKKPEILATKEQVENKEDLLQEEREIGEKIWESIKETKEQNKGKLKPQETEGVLGKEIKENILEKELEEKPEEEISSEKKGFFSFFKKKITEEKFEEIFQELEMDLFQNNVAFEVVHEIKNYMKNELVGVSPSDVNIEEKLKQALERVLINPPNFIKEIKKTLAVKQPYVMIFVGINGSGKTTTIAKVAHLLKKEKLSCCLAAADTFRAASIEQLQEHASRLNVPLIKKEYGSDPAAVGFDAISYAKKHKIDVVLIDTAGRMNTKDSLMKEMEKIVRVTKPDMKIFIGESTTGNDATEQAKAFNDLIDINGIILSKADVDEKGGTALSVSYITKKPILFLGTGQSYDDLQVFDKDKLIKSLGL
ncbi:MAG: signal recognition particle-docking protein FtsY [Nanoarchaeota archaeon]|nr:signal recognition particle-docking protein FtsY [Nanoarchaeota archaeon]